MRCVRCLFAVLMWVAGDAGAATAASSEWRYHAQLDAGTERLEIEVCAPGGATVALEALDDAANDYLIADPAVWVHTTNHLRAIAPGCARYAVALGRAADARRPERGYRVAGDLLVWPTTWLWWPQPERAPMRLTVELPAGWQLSTPWPQPDPAKTEYMLGDWPRYWSSLTAFGHFQRERVAEGVGQLDLAILGELDAAQRDKLHAWVLGVAGLLEHVVGGLPMPQVQVLVIATRSSGGGPVPWGQVYRGGRGGVHFFVNAEESAEAFRADWTGAHEISHLLHPYLGTRGSWMGEGLASYMQNVLRARAGTLSPQEGWERLIAGFGRGAKDKAQDQALEDVASGMGGSHAWMRVYWSGAAYWLGVDVELRRRTGGKLTLDDALTRFARCCLPTRSAWTPEQFARALDHETGQTLFLPAVRAAAVARNFPDLDPLYAELGIRRGDHGEVTGFDEKAPLAAIRDSIMAERVR